MGALRPDAGAFRRRFRAGNRVATGRVFNEYFARANVHQLAGFFRCFRDHLVDLRGETDSRVSILTPNKALSICDWTRIEAIRHNS